MADDYELPSTWPTQDEVQRAEGLMEELKSLLRDGDHVVAALRSKELRALIGGDDDPMRIEELHRQGRAEPEGGTDAL